MSTNIHRLPWSVNSAALKFARTNAWKQYKEFRVAYDGRHNNFLTRELVDNLTLMRLIITSITLSLAAEQTVSRA